MILQCPEHGFFLVRENVSCYGDHWYIAVENQLEKFGVPKFDPTDTGLEFKCPYCRKILVEKEE